MVATMILLQIVLRIPSTSCSSSSMHDRLYAPLILPSAFATDTFFVFEVPGGSFLRDMEEAAQMDADGRCRCRYIIVPLLKPAIIFGHRVPVHLDHERLHRPVDLPVERREIIPSRWHSLQHRCDRGGRMEQRDRHFGALALVPRWRCSSARAKNRRRRHR